eukprot:3804217-Alexandrium_andersonii.AAC.1
MVGHRHGMTACTAELRESSGERRDLVGEKVWNLPERSETTGQTVSGESRQEEGSSGDKGTKVQQCRQALGCAGEKSGTW